MLSFLPAFVVFPIHFSLQMLNLGFWALLITTLGAVKFVLPFAFVRTVLNPIMHFMMFSFGVLSVFLIKLMNRADWQYTINGDLNKQGWYLMMPNHLSYLDIILLIEFAAFRIPAPKFFLKKELIWLPFVGLGAWALDMPFMHRHSRQFIQKYPHLKGKDIETTRRCCEKFQTQPTTVINFVEGSRFTPEKHKQRNSPYTHLLPPKAGGIAYTLASMGELFTNILDVTIVYPDNTSHPMRDMLSGKMGRILIQVDVMPVSNEVVGDYFNDETFKTRFQGWLNDVWQRKNKLIAQLVGAK